MKAKTLAGALLTATLIAVALTPPMAANAALGAADFIKASGNVLKLNSGTGATINLRGTNIGGWLTQEDWMSPLGEYAVDRTGWSATASAGTAGNAINGSGTSRWTTNSNQTGSEWLQISLGAATVFNRLAIDNTANAGQYPRTVDVQVSSNGSTWVSVATQPGTDGVTNVK